MIEKQILKVFIDDKEVYLKYYKYVNLKFLKENYQNIYKLFNILHLTYESLEFITKEAIELKYHSNYLLKDSERKELSNLLDDIFSIEITNKDLVVSLLEEHRRRRNSQIYLIKRYEDGIREGPNHICVCCQSKLTLIQSQRMRYRYGISRDQWAMQPKGHSIP